VYAHIYTRVYRIASRRWEHAAMNSAWTNAAVRTAHLSVGLLARLNARFFRAGSRKGKRGAVRAVLPTSQEDHNREFVPMRTSGKVGRHL